MSNSILFDPLLVRYLAEELHERLHDRACASIPLFAAERTAVLPLDRGEALQLDLHPTRGWFRVLPWPSEPGELDATVAAVTAPPDERRLELRTTSTDRFQAQSRRLVVELHSNQWNALLVSDDDDRILSLLWTRSAGGRELRSGVKYAPPAPPRRFGAEATDIGAAREAWHAALAALPPAERRTALLARFAYTGAPNALPLLGRAALDPDPAALDAAFARWWQVRSLPPVQPVLLRLTGRLLPYPLPLEGTDSTPVASLLDGMEEALAHAGGTAPAAALPGIAAVRRRAEAAARRVERLESEIAGPEEVNRMRFWGDLILARKRLVPHGAESVRLQDWTGGLVHVALDPALTPAENANRWCEEARKRERADGRAAERIVSILASAPLGEELLVKRACLR